MEIGVEELGEGVFAHRAESQADGGDPQLVGHDQAVARGGVIQPTVDDPRGAIVVLVPDQQVEPRAARGHRGKFNGNETIQNDQDEDEDDVPKNHAFLRITAAP